MNPEFRFDGKSSGRESGRIVLERKTKVEDFLYVFTLSPLLPFVNAFLSPIYKIYVSTDNLYTAEIFY